MAKYWKKIQRADADFTGNVSGSINSVAVANVYTTSNKPTKSDVGLSNVTNNAQYHSGNKPTKADVGLANVDNESKATMFASPTFTGTPSGITKSHVGLANVGNTSVADIRSGVTKSDVGLGNVENASKATILAGTFTGDIGGTSAADIKTKAVAGEAAKSAVDGNSAITMVGGSLSIGTQSGGIYPFSVDSSGNLKIQDDEFQALADGTVVCKGSYTVNQDSSSNSRILLAGSGSGTAEMEIAGANPILELGSPTPLGASTLNIRRGGTGNQSRILFFTGSGSGSCLGGMGFANQPSAYNDQMWIHIGNGYDNSSPYKERCFSFDADGKMGMYANTKTHAGFTFGTDGTNKGVYVKDGGLSIGTSTVTDNDLRCTDVFASGQLNTGNHTNAIQISDGNVHLGRNSLDMNLYAYSGFIFNRNGAESMRIDNSGNLAVKGTGNSSFAGNLLVGSAGGTAATVKAYNDNNGIEVHNAAGTRYQYQKQNGHYFENATGYISTVSTTDMRLWTNQTGGVTVDGSTQNVSVGLTNPPSNAQFTVHSATDTTNVRISDDDTTGYINVKDGHMSIGEDTGLTNNNMNWDLGNNELGIKCQPICELDVDGDARIQHSLGVGTTAHATDGRVDAANDVIAFASDKRLKEDVEPISDALDKIDKLTGITYVWNAKASEVAGFDNRAGKSVGVYAQDVKEVLPEAVKLAPFDNDGNDGSLSGEEYLTVQYERIVPLLIESIKELKSEVKELKEKCSGCSK